MFEGGFEFRERLDSVFAYGFGEDKEIFREWVKEEFVFEGSLVGNESVKSMAASQLRLGFFGALPTSNTKGFDGDDPIFGTGRS